MQGPLPPAADEAVWRAIETARDEQDVSWQAADSVLREQVRAARHRGAIYIDRSGLYLAVSSVPGGRAGLGVFALCRHPAGTLLAQYPGTLVLEELFDKMYVARRESWAQHAQLRTAWRGDKEAFEAMAENRQDYTVQVVRQGRPDGNCRVAADALASSADVSYVLDASDAGGRPWNPWHTGSLAPFVNQPPPEAEAGAANCALSQRQDETWLTATADLEPHDELFVLYQLRNSGAAAKQRKKRTNTKKRKRSAPLDYGADHRWSSGVVCPVTELRQGDRSAPVWTWPALQVRDGRVVATAKILAGSLVPVHGCPVTRDRFELLSRDATRRGDLVVTAEALLDTSATIEPYRGVGGDGLFLFPLVSALPAAEPNLALHESGLFWIALSDIGAGSALASRSDCFSFTDVEI